jgi:putative nucleotidyltransferase with HDIG domain
LLDHSYRTFALAAALGELTGLDVDRELLFAAALLHDVGLPTTRDVAEQVGLSTAATDILLTAVTLLHSPGVTLAHGEVAYLLSAGAGLDVVLAAAFRG